MLMKQRIHDAIYHDIVVGRDSNPRVELGKSPLRAVAAFLITGSVQLFCLCSTGFTEAVIFLMAIPGTVIMRPGAFLNAPYSPACCSPA